MWKIIKTPFQFTFNQLANIIIQDRIKYWVRKSQDSCSRNSLLCSTWKQNLCKLKFIHFFFSTVCISRSKKKTKFLRLFFFTSFLKSTEVYFFLLFLMMLITINRLYHVKILRLDNFNSFMIISFLSKKNIYKTPL